MIPSSPNAPKRARRGDNKQQQQRQEDNPRKDVEMGNNSGTSIDHHGDNNDREVQMASFLFVIVGVGYLFPFSALTQPVDYWNLLFPDFNIEFPLATTYMYTNLIMLGLLVFFGGRPKFTPRIVGGFIGQFCVLVFVPTCYFFITNEQHNKLAVLGATAFAAVATAFLDSSLISMVSQYPIRVQESFQLGVGISTLIGSIYRDLTKLAFPPRMVVESSLMYFYCGAFTILICILAYYKLLNMPLSEKVMVQFLHKQQQQEEEAQKRTSSGTIPSESSSLLPKEEDGTSSSSSDTAKSPSTKWVVLKKVFFNELMVCFLFASTLSLWPPLVTEIKSFNFPSLQESGWWSLILLTIFSAMDCCGRIMARFRLCLTERNIWMAVLARFALFPLIIMVVQGRSMFAQDGFSSLFVALLGWSNGYVGTLCIILVNECVSTEELPIAGMFTSFFLNTGLVIGASMGLVMERLVVVGTS